MKKIVYKHFLRLPKKQKFKQLILLFIKSCMNTIAYIVIARVHYGVDRAPENAGPKPFSPPCPAQQPGTGCLFWHSLPLCPLRPPPHRYPGRVAVKNGW